MELSDLITPQCRAALAMLRAGIDVAWVGMVHGE